MKNRLLLLVVAYVGFVFVMNDFLLSPIIVSSITQYISLDCGFAMSVAGELSTCQKEKLFVLQDTAPQTVLFILSTVSIQTFILRKHLSNLEQVIACITLFALLVLDIYRFLLF